MISFRFLQSPSSRLTLACTRCAVTAVVAAAAVAGEVAVAVVAAAVAVDVGVCLLHLPDIDILLTIPQVGLAVTTIPSATVAGKRVAKHKDTTLGNRFSKGSAFDVDHSLFPRHLFSTDHGGTLMSRLVEVR